MNELCAFLNHEGGLLTDALSLLNSEKGERDSWWSAWAVVVVAVVNATIDTEEEKTCLLTRGNLLITRPSSGFQLVFESLQQRNPDVCYIRRTEKGCRTSRDLLVKEIPDGFTTLERWGDWTIKGSLLFSTRERCKELGTFDFVVIVERGI
ncbi:hypothetical protein OUZ56_031877 [Daphnia magna]|uniref:Uncharacterized protein n=1 Tax=Daphnia magna TaxID=35525 RepID=A0ABQ9ZVV1_9CRUS|nr:hypothetical protein OUZ56_031877 [Daphnia magna]